jgi:hypothetical protein
MQAQLLPAIHRVFGTQDIMQNIMGHLDVVHLHLLGQTTKSLRAFCFNRVYFTKFSNQNWENRGDSGESISIKDIQRLCGKNRDLSFIQTLDLWLEDLVVAHCETLISSLHHVTHLRLCCEQLCDLAVSCLSSGFKLLDSLHLVTCPLLTPHVFTSFQSLSALSMLRLESCSGIKGHPMSPQLLQQSLPLMTSLRCLELNDSVSPSNTEAFSVLSFCVCRAPQPLRVHCHPKSCIDEPVFQGDFHQEVPILGPASFFCSNCGHFQLRSERYITWFAESCCLVDTRASGCEFIVFAFPQENNRAHPSSAVTLCTCLVCEEGTRTSALAVQLDEYFQPVDCPPLAIPIRAELNYELQPELKGFSCMRRADGLQVPKTKSRQRQLWFACM